MVNSNTDANSYMLSSDDDDEFYDRTKKPTIQKTKDQQSIETADTLLDKKEAITKQMEEKEKLILNEKSRIVPEIESGTEGGDALDAYMIGLSTQLGQYFSFSHAFYHS